MWKVIGSDSGCSISYIINIIYNIYVLLYNCILCFAFNTPVSEVGDLVPITHYDYYVSSLCQVLHQT